MENRKKAATTPLSFSEIFVSTTKHTDSIAPYEPASGVYLGMFAADGLTDKLAQQEMASKNITNPNNRPLGIELKYVSQFYGKQPAMYLTYSNFFRPFPSQFAQNAKALGGQIQIG